MITTVRGVIQRIGRDSIVVLVGGIGLQVWVPRSVLETVDGVGHNTTLHTHLHVRESDIALYGFCTESELELFELLLAVTGVGPRLALAVISTLSPEVLTAAVAREEAAVLQRVPGIGKKTAERIMFHLRDKLRVEHLLPGVAMISDVDAEVIEALTALGYSVVEAQTALQRLPRDAAPDLEERIRQTLSLLGS
jgi:Holliday junction DNA helicase RuvA